MRGTVFPLVLALMVAVPALGGDVRMGHRGDPRTDLFVDVPVDNYDTSVVFPFGGSHHAVPGVVTINQPAPYFCRPHEQGFRTRAVFVEHLAVKHGLSDREIPALVLVDRNQVRYVGD
ncbi:MAG: hypothetical protein ABIR79_04355 [Candidatus Binatia bacterium]